MKIGNLELRNKPLFLAPMEDVTDPSFRYICKKFGADMVYTEFVSSDALIRDIPSSLKKLEIADSERPIGIQIYGNIPDAMTNGAIRIAEARPDVVDINWGCPVKKIAGRGAGSGMMREPEKLIAITKSIVEAIRPFGIPVTVKTRLGWDDDSKIIVDLAEKLQDIGIAALTIHGRTRCQMYKGESDWSLIGAVKNNPRMTIPIIGNGDIKSPIDAALAFNRYGVDGIMIGRATFGHPWLFREIRHYLDTGELLPEMSVNEKVDLALDQLSKSLEVKGPRKGVLEMRRHLSSYFKGLTDFKPIRLRLVTEDNPDELRNILEEIRKTYA
ncbi:MAG: tRNA dihydrouridine synthase DusB [Bacteroides sp.]|nr:tRNA dihydrouridine synthase DusB [Bacteroides sp.]